MLSNLLILVLVVLSMTSLLTLALTIKYYCYVRHLTVVNDRQPSEIRLGLESYPSIPKIPKVDVPVNTVETVPKPI
jgi:hypothetical protein